MQIETIIRALADPTRLRIMRLLGAMELAVGELAQILGQSQPRVSRHVAILCDAGLAARRREGSWAFLRAVVGNDAPIPEAVARLLATAELEDTAFAAACDEDRRQLTAIRNSREQHAAEYFAERAEDWDELRRLHSPDQMVEERLLSALGEEPLGQLLDIGTGTGRIAELFAGQADHVVALDKSLDMLRMARAKLQHLPSESVELVQGDFASLPFPAHSFDTVMLHQVLHFAQDPATAMAEAARVTKPGGRIAIVDFAAHSHEELRDRHAHTRLGFTDETIAGLLAAGDFASEAPLALEGPEPSKDKSLVVKIWLGRRGGSPASSTETHKKAAR